MDSKEIRLLFSGSKCMFGFVRPDSEKPAGVNYYKGLFNFNVNIADLVELSGIPETELLEMPAYLHVYDKDMEQKKCRYTVGIGGKAYYCEKGKVKLMAEDILFYNNWYITKDYIGCVDHEMERKILFHKYTEFDRIEMVTASERFLIYKYLDVLRVVYYNDSAIKRLAV
jgi:hypothetical protein